jgi:hypothetical protein
MMLASSVPTNEGASRTKGVRAKVCTKCIRVTFIVSSSLHTHLIMSGLAPKTKKTGTASRRRHVSGPAFADPFAGSLEEMDRLLAEQQSAWEKSVDAINADREARRSMKKSEEKNARLIDAFLKAPKTDPVDCVELVSRFEELATHMEDYVSQMKSALTNSSTIDEQNKSGTYRTEASSTQPKIEDRSHKRKSLQMASSQIELVDPIEGSSPKRIRLENTTELPLSMEEMSSCTASVPRAKSGIGLQSSQTITPGFGTPLMKRTSSMLDAMSNEISGVGLQSSQPRTNLPPSTSRLGAVPDESELNNRAATFGIARYALSPVTRTQRYVNPEYKVDTQ